MIGKDPIESIDMHRKLLCRVLLGGGMLLTLAISASFADEPAKTREVKIQDIKLNVPQSWKQEEPSSRLRAGQFAVPPVEGDKEPAELSIFFFGGASGGVDANIERWVKQFTAEGRKQKLLTGQSPQGKYVLLDLSGTYNKPVGPPMLGRTEAMPGARSLSVILAVENKGNYFLRLTGPEKTVTEAAEAFRRAFGGDAKKEQPHERAE